MSDEETKMPEFKNSVTIEDVGPCKKKVVIEIPEEAITAAVDKEYGELGRETVVPGFRKGRAPRRLLEKRFGKDISKQVKLKLLADAVDSAGKDNELDMLGEPDVDHEKIELPDSGPMKFDFEIEVRPEFELPKLEGIEVEKTAVTVGKAEVDDEIEQLRKRMGLWALQEGATVEVDDQVIADVTMMVEGEEEAQREDNSVVFVRANGFAGKVPVENLDELLAGAKQGDVKKTSVDVSETFYNEQYRGKKVDVSIEVKDIKRLEAAEMNEDFFSQIGIADEAELKEKVEEMLEARSEQQQRRAMGDQVYEYLLEKTKFELPSDVFAAQSAQILQRQYSNLLMQGLEKEKLEEQMEQLRSSSGSQAEEQLKLFFVMAKIAEKLEISVSEEEINGQIAQVAMQRGQRPDKVREQMARDGSLSQFGLQLREQKCIEKLLESAKVKEVSAKKKAAKKPSKKAAAKSEGLPVNKKADSKKKTAKKKASKD